MIFNNEFGIGDIISIIALIGSLIGAIISIVKSKKAKESEEKAEKLQIDIYDKIHDQNIKIELFEKRYKIYNKAKILANLASQEHTCTHDLIRKFNNIIDQAKLLFDNEIIEYLENMRSQAMEVIKLHYIHNSKGMVSVVDKYSDIEDWFIFKVPGELDTKFNKYLNLSNYGKE